ncbi:class I SAM-dependent methyltransferase [Pseudanabaena sp. PCC 6802]|uniref:class I SAM-dependent methyltransferase n=1 Tax=Pseudanabaena sp. PCC 6802 TaxID=118173 RepID=UPI00034C4779|nr:class I SAM-dependent methyltransferase [Pseudanabaena sp. PCC 6802]
MQSLPNYEYSYADSASGHHHAYLLPVILETISQYAPQHAKLRVLDLGCGNGSLSQQIAKQGHEVIGVEDSSSGVLFASQHFPECKFLHASVYDLPYADLENTFDVVLSVDTIEHLLYPRELLRAARRCLKPGGNVILTTPYHGYLKNLAIALLGKMDRHFDPLWDGGHVKFFSVKTLARLVEQEGFINCQFKFAGRLPFFWKGMLCSATLASS